MNRQQELKLEILKEQKKQIESKITKLTSELSNIETKISKVVNYKEKKFKKEKNDVEVDLLSTKSSSF